LVPTEISLNTKELHEAKKTAADVTQASERLLPLLRDKMISAEDAKKILVKVALSHSAKLDAVAANEIAYGADVESSRRADIATGWAYRLLAAHGKNARIGEQEVRDMRAAGLDDGIIVQTQQTITSLRAGGAFPPVEEKILDLLEAFDIHPPNGNYQQAQQLYLRGLATALLDTPMGDVFDNEWQKLRTAALPNAEDEGKVFHSFRHWLNNGMKQAGVSLEIRRDVIGHSNGADVNSGRYADAASLALMSKALETVTLPTSHLEAFPIRLSTMVVEHLPRPRRKSRNA
jgi:hypothetical protein